MKPILLLAGLTITCALHAAVAITAGPLKLTLNQNDGRVTGLTVAGVAVRVAPDRPLVEVRQVQPGSVFHPFLGPVRREGATWVLDGEAHDTGLSGKIRFRDADGMLALECALASATPEGRGFTIKIAVAIAETDLRWSGTLLEEITAQPKTLYGTNVFPISAIASPASKWALAAAIPPTDPVTYDTHFRDGEFGLYFYVGTSPLTKTHPNQVDFTADLYSVDPRWAFRSALDRYYRAFPAFYRQRAKTAGAWCFHMSPEENELAKSTCTYYEAGGAELSLTPGTEGLRGAGYETEGYWTSHVTDPQEWARKNAIPAAASHDMQVFPYTIVGQRQIYMLPQPELIKDYQQQLQAFENWTIDTVIPFQNPVQANGFRTVSELKEIIRNSALYRPDGRMVIEPRFYTGNTLTFPLNPSPSLFHDTSQETIAKYTLDYYVPFLLKALPQLKGFYVDSMGAWNNFQNYRSDHLAYAKYPLNVDAAGVPVMRNLAPHYEYLKALGELLHPSGRLVFANGITEGNVTPRHDNVTDSDAARPTSRFFLAAVSDIAGAESGVQTTLSHMAANRVMMGPKPYVILAKPVAAPGVIESYLKRGLVMGVFASLGDLYYSRPELRHLVEEMRDVYLPALRLLHAAGWQPVRGVTGLNKVSGERFGDPSRGPSYLTLYNDGSAAEQLTLQLDSGIFTRRYKSAADRMGSASQKFPLTGGSCVVAMAPGQIRVLEFIAN